MIVHARAYAIKIKGMILDYKVCFRRRFTLPLFNAGIDKLEYFAALNTDHMIVMGGIIQFKHSRATLEFVPNHETGRFELSQHTVHGRETDLFACFQ